MRYSVFNVATRSYDYYDGPGPVGIHAGAPPVRWMRNRLGATPEQASWRVPVGAKKVGSGDLPQGRVAAMGDAESGFDSWVRDNAGMVTAGLVLYMLLRRSR